MFEYGLCGIKIEVTRSNYIKSLNLSMYSRGERFASVNETLQNVCLHVILVIFGCGSCRVKYYVTGSDFIKTFCAFERSQFCFSPCNL